MYERIKKLSRNLSSPSPSPSPSLSSSPIVSGKSYRNFIEAIHSPFSRNVYRNVLKQYLRFRKLENCDKLLEGDPRLIESQLIEYIIYLREERKLVGGSINTVMATIRKFYDINDIELRWKKIKMYVGKGKGNNKKDRPYTHHEIARMLEKADQRGRIAILLMYSSGMRVGALPSLKIRNLQKIEKYNLYRIIVYEGEDEEYVTFCTPECAAEIDSYLEYRQRHGEHPLRDDAPLIREEFDINDEMHASRPRELSVQTFRMMIKNSGHRSGVIEKRALAKGTRVERRPVKETHGYRKAFQTTAITTGMNPLFSELLMGHTSGGLALDVMLDQLKAIFLRVTIR